MRDMGPILQELEALRAENARLAQMWERQADRWYVLTPEHDAEWFDTRSDAERYAVEWMEEDLRDSGEGREDRCIVMAVVSSTDEIRGATSDDDSERGQWLRERGWDYEIMGYRCTPGEACIAGDGAHPAAEAERAAIVAWLRAMLNDLRRGPGNTTVLLNDRLLVDVGDLADAIEVGDHHGGAA